MKAMILERICSLEQEKFPLTFSQLPDPVPDENDIVIKVSTCAVCHTELDEIEGRTPPPKFPIVLGHQVVGIIQSCGSGAKKFRKGDRVGVAWIFSACRNCEFCKAGLENLCADFKATGRDANGGYAEYMIVNEDFAYPIPNSFSDSEAAPLLCAGSIGYRSIKLTNLQDGQLLGLTGFGGSGHLVLKMVKHRYPNSKVFVFARKKEEQDFAIQLGADWAGDTSATPPEKLHSIIDTTPAWKPVLEALKNLKPGGRLVINAIRKEPRDQQELLRLDYPTHLWMEKEIKSVANITRNDVSEFLQLADEISLKPEIQEFKLEDANQALIELKHQNVRGSKVLRIL
ncbi:zinc-dependent alcohol dehydrogenase family protein [bacterium]|nr:zinc-dependent alcohol dehydrogenase family protein [bacterium]